MQKNSKIYVAGHRGLVGSAILRALEKQGFTNLITRPSSEVDLRDYNQTADFFAKEKPEYVFLAAAKVGGIQANNTYRAEFLYDNMMIQNNVIHQAYVNNVKKLLFLGSLVFEFKKGVAFIFRIVSTKKQIRFKFKNRWFF